MRITFAIGILIFAILVKWTYLWTFNITPDGIPAPIPLKEFPQGILGENWMENHFPLDEQIEIKAGVSEYINSTYVKRGTFPIWFYVGYYDGHSVESMHQPELCFPGGGWDIINKRIETFAIPEVPHATFNLVEFRKSSVELKLTAYTFFYEGKFQPSQAFVEKGRIFGERHFAIITVATNVRGTIEEARNNLEELLSKTLPQLLKHLPKSIP